MALSPTTKIPGYELTQMLGQGGMSSVYRATKDGKSFAIKVFRAFSSGPDSIYKFRKEASSIARVNHPGLVKVVEVGEAEAQPYLVMELVEGESLAKVLERGPLSESRLMAVAQDLTRVLTEIHRCGLVHRDLKPANILIEPSGAPKIIDLGLAIGHTEDTGSEESIAGTFLYSSPEQIGMIKRAMDGRSDLYSLGCVLFECATGQLPYLGRNLSDLLRMLSSQPVPDPRHVNPGVSAEFSKLVQKLLARDPDDRYQNALELSADLSQIASPGQSKVEVGSLEMPLVGRDAELEKLKDCWKSTKSSRGHVVVLDGPAGCGKSRLLYSLAHLARAEGSTVLLGKSTSGASVPFGSLSQALDGFLRGIRELPESERQNKQQKVKKALGEFSALLKSFSQEISALLEKDVKEVLEVQAPEIFYEATATFLIRLSKEFSAVLFIFEDLQWLDDASKEVLERVCKHVKENAFMVAATCRITEADLKFLGDSAVKLTLAPLNSEEMSKMVRSFLGGRNLPEGNFLPRIAHLSQGNPLAIFEYLRTLLDSGCLYPAGDSWAADLGQIEKLSLSADLVELIVKRMSALDATTQRVLRTAAVLGSTFDKEVLSRVTGIDVSMALYQGTQAHLLGWEHHDQFAFVHDRVQEALLLQIGPEDLKEIHQKAAEVMDELPEEKRKDQKLIFAIASHYAAGRTEKNPGRVYDACLEAGTVAMQIFAHSEAKMFLIHAQEIASKVEPARDSLALREALAAVYLRMILHNEALKYCNLALEVAKDPIQRSQLYCYRMEAELGIVDIGALALSHETALAELGFGIRKSKLGFMLSTLAYGIVGFILHKTGWFYGSAKGERAKLYRQLIRIHDGRAIVASTTGDIPMILATTFQQFYYAHFLGPSPELARAYAAYALFSAPLHFEKALEKYASLATTMALEKGDPVLHVKIKGDLAIAFYVAGNHLRTEKMTSEVYRTDQRWLSPATTVTVYGMRAQLQIVRGFSSDAILFQSLMISAFGKDGNSNPLVPITHAGKMLCFAQMGKVQQAIAEWKIIEDNKLLELIKTYKINMALAYGNFVGYYFEAEEFTKMEHAISVMKGLKLNAATAGPIAWVYYSYHMLARSRMCWDEMMATGKVSRAQVALFKETARDLKATRATIHSVYLLVAEGALAWFAGDIERALELLSEGESRATRYDIPLARFEALMYRAQIYKQQGYTAASIQEVKEAMLLATEHSWVPRMKRLRKHFHLEESTHSHSSHLSADILSTDGSSDYLSGRPSFSGSYGPLGSQGISSTGSHRRSSSKGASDAYQIYKLKRHLDALLRINRAASQRSLIEDQTRATLDEVIKIFNAERAFFFTASNAPEAIKGLVVRTARNAHGQDLSAQSPFSRSLVDQAMSSRASVIQGEGDAPTASESTVIHHLRSAMAAPLLRDDGILGVLYVDSTIARGLFQADDLDLLNAVSGYFAMRMEASRSAQLELQNSLLEKEQELHEIKVKTAHAAGMAEIATGSIHNIGNTLTVVTATFDLLKERVKTSKVTSLSSACDTLNAVKDQMQDKPLSAIQNGPQLVSLLIKLGGVLKSEREDYLAKIESIEQGIENVKEIIVAQQDYAKAGLAREKVVLSEFVEEILNLQDSSLKSHHIRIEKAFSQVPLVHVQKNKLLNVVLNLINNAKDAMEGLPEDKRVIRIEISQTPMACQLRVTDCGVGIEKEKLSRIFGRGGSTKKTGHGFGLHMSVNAMAEMGGSLEVSSPGPGAGATFTVTIPFDAIEERPELLRVA